MRKSAAYVGTRAFSENFWFKDASKQRVPERRRFVSKSVTHEAKCNADLETSWGYMVKKLSAHGGCLGNRRR